MAEWKHKRPHNHMVDEQTIKIIPAEKAVETKESIELELGAKGLYRWSIKLKDEVLTLDTIKRLVELDKNLREVYTNNAMQTDI